MIHREENNVLLIALKEVVLHDTAPDGDNGSVLPYPFGWHSVDLDDFYDDMDNFDPGHHYIMW